ncbi:MAG: hypothetical protein ACKOWJ_03475 [Micrococcales bacterium]
MDTPAEMSVSDYCVGIPFNLHLLDEATGAYATVAQKSAFSVTVIAGDGYIHFLPNQWDTLASQTSGEINYCGADPTYGARLIADVIFETSYTHNGRVYTETNWFQVTLVGALKPISIACMQGNVVKVVTDQSPSCPAGFKKVNLPIKNGKAQTTTITCLKGLVVKRVTGYFPACPAGFRRK